VELGPSFSGFLDKFASFPRLICQTNALIPFLRKGKKFEHCPGIKPSTFGALGDRELKFLAPPDFWANLMYLKYRILKFREVSKCQIFKTSVEIEIYSWCLQISDVFYSYLKNLILRYRKKLNFHLLKIQ
jgi:hypothetical protein